MISRFIFGGFNAREAKHYNDMWCYDPKSQKWSEVHGFGKKPSARRRHTAVCIGSQVDFQKFPNTDSETQPRNPT